MSSNIAPIDISNMPDLMRLVEDMKHAKEPRILKKGSAPVAMLVPMATAKEPHKTIDTFDFKSLDEVKASLLEAGYPEAEVKDMIEAMSELPQYANTTLQKGQ